MFSFITDNRIHAFMAYANLAMSPKRLETELTNITKKGTSVPYPFFVLNILLFTLFTFSYRNFFSLYLFVLTYFDSSRRHTHATTHAIGTQIVRAKMMSPDAIFLQGKQVVLSLSRSLFPQKTLKIHRSCYVFVKKFELDL